MLPTFLKTANAFQIEGTLDLEPSSFISLPYVSNSDLCDSPQVDPNVGCKNIDDLFSASSHISPRFLNASSFSDLNSDDVQLEDCLVWASTSDDNTCLFSNSDVLPQFSLDAAFPSFPSSFSASILPPCSSPSMPVDDALAQILLPHESSADATVSRAFLPSVLSPPLTSVDVLQSTPHKQQQQQQHLHQHHHGQRGGVHKQNTVANNSSREAKAIEDAKRSAVKTRKPSHLDFLAPWLKDGNDDKTCTTTQPSVSAGNTASTKHNNNNHQHSTYSPSPSHVTHRRQPPTNALTITRILPSPLLSSRALVAKPFSSAPSPSLSPSISPSSSVPFISAARSASSSFFSTNTLPQQANPAPSAPKRRTAVSISAMAAQHCPACCLFEPMAEARPMRFANNNTTLSSSASNPSTCSTRSSSSSSLTSQTALSAASATSTSSAPGSSLHLSTSSSSSLSSSSSSSQTPRLINTNTKIGKFARLCEQCYERMHIVKKNAFVQNNNCRLISSRYAVLLICQGLYYSPFSYLVASRVWATYPADGGVECLCARWGVSMRALKAVAKKQKVAEKKPSSAEERQRAAEEMLSSWANEHKDVERMPALAAYVDKEKEKHNTRAKRQRVEEVIQKQKKEEVEQRICLPEMDEERKGESQGGKERKADDRESTRGTDIGADEEGEDMSGSESETEEEKQEEEKAFVLSELMSKSNKRKRHEIARSHRRAQWRMENPSRDPLKDSVAVICKAEDKQAMLDVLLAEGLKVFDVTNGLSDIYFAFPKFAPSALFAARADSRHADLYRQQSGLAIAVCSKTKHGCHLYKGFLCGPHAELIEQHYLAN